MASQAPPIDGAPTQAEGLSRSKAPIMSEYNVKALTALRTELKTKIVMGPHLNDMLEKSAGGFMTRPEAQSVLSDSESQMGRLIDILKGKGDEEFRIFCKMLQKSNYPAWAEKLEQEAESFKSKVLGEVLPRKQSRSSASSGETPSSSAEKRTQDEYKKMQQDLEKQDFRSMRERCCPDRAIRLLYANAHKRLVQLLKPHLDAVKDAADTYIQLGLHEAEGEKPCDIQSVQRISELINQMSTRSTWDSTCFLQQAVDAIPAMAIEREVAEAILAHYNCHLDIYNQAKLLKDHLTTKRSESNNEGKEIIEFEELVPVKITSSKPYDEFTCKDCHHLQARILSQAYSIPEDQIICYDALPCQSTTVIFLVPNGFIYVIMQHTTRLETVWTLLELDVIEVAISGFTFKPTVGCFLALLRGSKPFTADLLGVTEILPFQMHCLIDPGSKEPLSGQLLGNKRIAQHWRSHEEFMSETAADEGVEAATEISGKRLPAKMEQMEEAEGMRAEREPSGSDELQSHIQELEGQLKESESKRMYLIHDNMALRNKLKAVHEEKASLKEKLLSVMCLQLEQSVTPLTSPSTPPHQFVAQPDAESKVEELAAQVQQAEGEKVELEQENSALQKKLAAQVQQAEDEKVELKEENSVLQKKLIQQVEKYNYHMAVVTQKLPISNPVAKMMLEAATNGYLSVMQLLVKQFINVKDKDGRTPLLRAAERGHTDLVKHLATHYEGDIFHKMENSQCALHLAADRGHLPVLQCLCPMFGDRVLDRDGNDETCLDIARRLGRESIVEYLTRNYPQLEGKGSADKEYVVTGLSDGASNRAHHRRWWLKAPVGSPALALPPSASMEQAGGPVEMEGEVEFRRDTQSNQTKAVSGTEWMYQRRALERGKQAAGSNQRWHRFTRYHKRWLADHVQTEEEESCGQWLLHQSPEVATVREAQEYRTGRVRYRYTTMVEKVPSPCKRVKLNPEEEETSVVQPSHNIEWQAAQEDPNSSLLQSESYRIPDDRWKHTLKVNHPSLRQEIRVNDVLPRFHSFLTDVEYWCVQGSDKADNIDQVDQLFRILLTKEKREFEEFLVALWQQGYADLAARLAEEAGVVLNTSSGMATAVGIPSVVLDTFSGCATRAGTPKSKKHAMKEKGMLYYPLIESLLDSFYDTVIIPFEAFVMGSTDAEFQRLMRRCEKVIRRKEHLIACKVHLHTQRQQFLHDLQHKYGLWKDALEYQLLREVIMELRDKSLTLRLEQYEVLLREKGNTILMQCQREFRKCPDLCLKLKADHNTALATLCRLKSFLVNDVGLTDTSFAGFREGCIELFFRISSESASTALDPLCSHAFRSKLLSMGVRRVTLSDHWVISIDTGHVIFLQSSERTVTDHDAEDTIADVTQSSDMTALIAGHSGILADLMDVPSPCKRVKLNPEEEETSVVQPSHNIEWQAAQEDPNSSLLQSEPAADTQTAEDMTRHWRLSLGVFSNLEEVNHIVITTDLGNNVAEVGDTMMPWTIAVIRHVFLEGVTITLYNTAGLNVASNEEKISVQNMKSLLGENKFSLAMFCFKTIEKLQKRLMQTFKMCSCSLFK